MLHCRCRLEGSLWRLQSTGQGHGCGRVRVRRVRRKGDMMIHPVADGLDAIVALIESAELIAGESEQSVGLAVATWIEVLDHSGRKAADRDFGKRRWINPAMVEFHDRGILECQITRRRAQTHAAVAGDRIRVELRFHRGIQAQPLRGHDLTPGVCSVHVEQKVGTRIGNPVLQGYLQIDADQCFVLMAIKAASIRSI